MWSLLLLTLAAAAPPGFEVEKLGGGRLVGPIVALDADSLTVRTGDGPVALDAQDVARLSRVETAGQAPPSDVSVELIDGSRLAATDYTIGGRTAQITAPGGDVTELAPGDVAAVQFQPATEQSAAEWTRILDSARQSDLLVVRKGPSLDYHRGALGEVTSSVVEFHLDGERLPVPRTKVFGLIYYRSAGRDLPEAACWLTEADGSRWAVRSIRLEDDLLRWTTPLGIEVSRAPADVARLDFSQGKIVYLSDLEPESSEWTPYFGPARELPVLNEFFRPREDRGLDLGPLRIDGVEYAKGLALHSRTRLVYRLPGRFRRFQAVAGIHDRVRPQGNVRLVIRGDDRVLWEGSVAGTEGGQEIDVDLGGVRRLEILADYGDALDVGDHLDLGKARIIK